MKTILVYGLKNVVGGIENYLMLMQKYLHKDLTFTFLVEEAQPFIYDQTIHEYGGEVVYLPERHKLKEYIQSYKDILRHYKRQTDTLYVNVGHISFDIIPIKMALREGYRVITHSHNAMQEPIKKWSYKIRQDILRFLGMYQLKHLKVQRLAVSQQAGEFLYQGKPYQLVTPGIEVHKFAYDVRIRNALRKRYGIEESVVLGFVGRLVSVKNPLFLIDILKATKSLIPNVKLMVVGDGELKEDMVHKAELLGITEDILYTGEVHNVWNLLQVMDLLLAPSLNEGLGLFVIEAQCAGLPCICAKGAFPEAINVTENVHFCNLSLGEEIWGGQIKNVLSLKNDRASKHIMVEKSIFNIEYASKKLLEMIG